MTCAYGDEKCGAAPFCGCREEWRHQPPEQMTIEEVIDGD